LDQDPNDEADWHDDEQSQPRIDVVVCGQLVEEETSEGGNIALRKI
jgi:hypothetical protein